MMPVFTALDAQSRDCYAQSRRWGFLVCFAKGEEMFPPISQTSDELVAELKSAQEKLKEAEQLLALAAGIGSLGVWHFDIQSDLMACDDRWYEIVGHDPAGPRVNSMEKWRQIVHPEDRDAVTEVDQTSRALLGSKEPYSIQFRVVRPDGEIRWVRSLACVFGDENGAPGRAVGFMADITEWWRAQQREQDQIIGLREQTQLARRNSMVDPLTGIANRLRFDIELRRACANAVQGHTNLVLAMIRVTNFDRLAELHGSQGTDASLAALAEIVACAAWRPYDFVARYSPSTIAMLMPETSMPEVVLDRIAKTGSNLIVPQGPLELVQGYYVATQDSALAPEFMLQACERVLAEKSA